MGMGLRYFAFGTLGAPGWCASTLHWEDVSRVSNVTAFAVGIPLGLCALASPIVIPFSAGFASAYYWRGVTWDDEGKGVKNALWVSAMLFLPFHLLLCGTCLLLTLPIDYAASDSGVKRGAEFWNSHQGRQFFGDFSTRDEDD